MRGGDASRQGHLSIVDIKWVGFRIFRYILIDMFGPTGPKHMEVKSEGGGMLADTAIYHL